VNNELGHPLQIIACTALTECSPCCSAIWPDLSRLLLSIAELLASRPSLPVGQLAELTAEEWAGWVRRCASPSC